ncbi:MAG: hypothetical protein USCAAHI_01793 [Beijerinckiaceae bacterium]|nr:MAG: hypothetical protein USCAAHI_01793 [Beijerinckiaceae bacterium]
MKSKLGKGLSALTGTVLATPQAAENDQVASACRIEETRYERAILDFESAVRRERDKMRNEHLEAMRIALNGQEEAE